MRKILVCGGRHFNDYETLSYWLGVLNPTVVVHGAAPGADSLAASWCDEYRREQCPHPADWQTYGKAAGPRRNTEMLALHDDIELVIAFPGGRGTQDMITKARDAGLPILEV